MRSQQTRSRWTGLRRRSGKNNDRLLLRNLPPRSAWLDWTPKTIQNGGTGQASARGADRAKNQPATVAATAPGRRAASAPTDCQHNAHGTKPARKTATASPALLSIPISERNQGVPPPQGEASVRCPGGRLIQQGALWLTSEKPPKALKVRAIGGLSRASYQNRTDDLFITSETLYRLS